MSCLTCMTSLLNHSPTVLLYSKNESMHTALFQSNNLKQNTCRLEEQFKMHKCFELLVSWTCPGCNRELNFEFTYMSQAGLPLGHPAVLLWEEHRPDTRATAMKPKLQPDRPLCSYTFYFQMHCRAVPIVCMM